MSKSCGCNNNITYGNMQDDYNVTKDTSAQEEKTMGQVAEELTIGVLFTRVAYLERTVDNLLEATSTLLQGLNELTDAFETIGEVLNEEENPGPKHGGRIDYKDKFTGENLPDDLDKGGHD